jgi:hypothetical protein
MLMAKKSKIAKNEQRRAIVARYALRRARPNHGGPHWAMNAGQYYISQRVQARGIDVSSRAAISLAGDGGFGEGQRSLITRK